MKINEIVAAESTYECDCCGTVYHNDFGISNCQVCGGDVCIYCDYPDEESWLDSRYFLSMCICPKCYSKVLVEVKEKMNNLIRSNE